MVCWRVGLWQLARRPLWALPGSLILGLILLDCCRAWVWGVAAGLALRGG